MRLLPDAIQPFLPLAVGVERDAVVDAAAADGGGGENAGAELVRAEQFKLCLLYTSRCV